MVDVSGSMDSDNGYPKNTAIGLGIRIAENSKLGNRVMTFSSRPTWVNLENTPSFTERVDKVRTADWGYNTDFYAALSLVLKAASTAKLSADDVAKLTLVVLSDMQIDNAGDHTDALFARIKKEFEETGLRVCGAPYPVPKLVFWNLRTTNGFPSTSTDKNSIMISGGSDAVLNDICEKGFEAINEINPWNMFVEIMNKERYKSLEQHFAHWLE
jgi:hypothetical protein